MRPVLTFAVLAAAGLLATGSAIASSGMSKTPLAKYGEHLYGQYCISCHGANAAGRLNQTSTSTGGGPGRAQGQQNGIGPSLQGVGALAADFYLRTGYMPLRRLGLQPRREPLFLSDHQIRALVAYVASFGGPARSRRPSSTRRRSR
jgi:ubiquinol-cytochrome c reductase cytochrome c subunit